jgi:hypothetical protein
VAGTRDIFSEPNEAFHMAAKGSRSLRNTEKLKKKAATKIARPKVSRITGATKGARTALKRASLKARSKAAK